MCDKVTYQTRQAALDAIAGIKKDRRVFRSKKKPVQPYRCNECGGWHVRSFLKRY